MKNTNNLSSADLRQRGIYVEIIDESKNPLRQASLSKEKDDQKQDENGDEKASNNKDDKNKK